ncbi:hypothetical protein FRB94_013853 [Tulasnella sp. JGI-2019a]|nr:hypothetical protein FRB94_013853 [Tulasnella sp. JGI-2019a]
MSDQSLVTLGCSRVLLMTDILLETFELMSTDGQLGLLAASTQTCRAWEGIVLKVLWGGWEIDFMDLLEILGPVAMTSKQACSLDLPCSSSTAPWDRFRLAASRIKRLCLQDKLSPRLVTDLSNESKRSSPPIPRLRILHIGIELDRNAPEILETTLLFMNNGLQTLIMDPLEDGEDDGSDDQINLTRILSQIPVISPKLTTLCLIACDLRGYGDSLLEMLRSPPRLRRLTLFNLGDIGPLATFMETCPNLEVLELVADEWSTGGSRSAHLNPFPALAELTIGCSSAEGLIPLLWRVEKLERLRFQCSSGRISVEELGELSGRLSGIWHIGFGDSDWGSLSLKELWPLTRCRALETLRTNIRGLGAIDWTDGDVESLVSHLPRLKELAVRHYYYDGDIEEWPTPKATLQALVAIITACSAISVIELEIDATVIPHWVTKESHASLKSVVVCNSPIVDSIGVASFLIRLASSDGSSIQMAEEVPDSDYDSIWEDTMQLVQQGIAFSSNNGIETTTAHM